jgi:hypothetical protein
VENGRKRKKGSNGNEEGKSREREGRKLIFGSGKIERKRKKESHGNEEGKGKGLGGN